MTDNPLPQSELPALTVDSIVDVPAPAPPNEGEAFFDLETQRLQIEKLKIVNHALMLDTGHRDKWAKRLFPLCAAWLIAVVVVLVFEGFHLWGFHLDNSVVITFVGTTTADVLGLGYIVVNYL